jgi:hypothetical protein
MNRRRHEDPPPAPAEPDKLSGVRSLAHDEDERPSREDRDYGSTIFNTPVVPLPKFLKRRKKTRD